MPAGDARQSGRTPLDVGSPRTSRAAERYAALVVWLRFVIVAGWVGLAVAATVVLPTPQGGGAGDLDGLVPGGNPYVETEIRSVQEFGFPLLARTVLVQRNPDGLSPYAQAEAVLRAGALSRQQYEDVGPILGALPLVNSLGIFPGSNERGTTALTYLFMPPGAGFFTQTRAGSQFAQEHLSDPDDAFVGVTGSIPARVEQGRIVESSLRTVEIATVTAITLIVGLNFRSLVAPVLALGTAGLSFLITLRISGALGQALGISIPGELRPLLLALLLGVATDYVIFFLSGAQHSLRAGMGRLAAARTATAEFAPIVAVAGVTVAAGTAALLAAESQFFRAFGPGMALTVLVASAVSVTLVPALLALLGRAAFWPSPPEVSVDPGDMPGPGPSRLVRGAFRGGGVVWMTRKPVALAVVVACTTALVLAALPLRNLSLGLSFVPSLPSENQALVAADAATEGFAEGILSPTELLLEGDGITDQMAELSRLRNFLQADPGVAGVLGPGQEFISEERGIVLSPSGDAARYLIVLDDEPLGASAIETFDRLEEQLPTLLRQAGLEGVQGGLAGDTALASLLTASTSADLGRIAVAALGVNLLLLVLFLRALVAPLYLLATSVLALCASLGLATWVFQDLLGHDGLTFYVPFAAAVLLVALGSDYNIFGVGHVWGVARYLPLREAIIQAVPRTTRAINAAAITLAVSFGLLAIVPLRPFRELAFVMGVGIVLDAVVVRTFLVPTLLVLVGRLSWWPATPPAKREPAKREEEVVDA